MSTTHDQRVEQVTAARRALAARRLRGLDEPATGIPARPEGEPVPLSPEQHSLWVVDQLMDDNSAYGVHEVVRLHGRLEVNALRTALDALAARHEPLRTVVAETPHGPVQVIRAPGPVELVVPTGGDDPMAVVEAELLTGFDLAAGPLLRVVLVGVGVDEHILVLHLHHLIADERSCEVLARDLSRLYRSAVEVGPAARTSYADAEPGRRQYGDYARWARDRLAGDGRGDRLRHWREALTDLDGHLELPSDRDRPARPTYQGRTASRTLPEAMAARLRATAGACGVTPFVALLAAFATTLGGYSGQSRFAIGTPTSGRGLPETESMVGLFMNTVAIPVDLTSRPSFRDVTLRLRDRVVAALDHQDVTFEEVVRALRVDRRPGRNPIFQVMFQYLDDHEDWWDLPGLRCEPVEPPDIREKFDLTLIASAGATGLQLDLRYATDLFDASTAERLLDSVVTVLDQAVTDPAVEAGQLALSPPAVLRSQVDGWNDTAAPLPGTTLARLFADQVARTPGAGAVVGEDGSLTYAELDTHVTALADRLRAAGVGPGTLVGVCLERSPALVATLLAVHRAGGAYVPLEPDHPDGRLRAIASDTGMPVVLVDPTTAPRWRDSGRTTLDVTDAGAAPHAAGERAAAKPAPESGPDDLAYVIFTSGSSGRPKGVAVPHRGVVNRLRWMQRAYPIGAGDTAVQKTPYGFDVSVWEFFWPLTVGARLAVARPGGHRDPAYLAELLRRTDATVVHFVPSMLAEFLADPAARALPRLRHVVCSGEALPVELANRARRLLNGRLHNLYGPTEASIDVTAHTWDTDPDARTVPIGRPIDNTQLYVLDGGLRPLPVGVAGELYIGGLGLARCYVGQPALTAEAFLPNPFHPGRMYRTGDLARYRPDGAIEFLGRNDDQVKLHGHRIELDEIASTVLTHPQVRQAVVVPRRTSTGAPRLVAYLVPAAGTAPEPAQLRSHLARTLPDHMLPSGFVWLDSLPLTASGKVDRKALPEAGTVTAAEPAGAPPRTATERDLVAIWCDVLDEPRVGVHDNFFDVGGDSILGIRIANRARAAGLAVTPSLMIQHQTVAELAAALDGTAAAPEPAGDLAPAAAAAAVDVATGPVESVHRLSPLQEGMLFETLADPDGNTYAQYHAFDVAAPLDEAALADAVRRVAARHPALRATFAWTGRPYPVLIVHREADIPIAVEDWRGGADGDRYAAFLAADRAKPVDLTRSPHRFTALRTDEAAYRLVWRTHHIVLDGWSTDLVVKELFAFLDAARRGQPAPDLPAAVSFADHRSWLEGRRADGDGDHWRRLLDGFTTPTALPVATTGSAGGTALELRDLDARCAARLAGTAQRWRVSVGAVVNAAWALLLRRYGGGDDVVFGVTVNGRSGDLPGIERVVGLLMNTLPLRVRVAPGADVATLARAVQGQLADLHDYVHCPLVEVKRHSGVPADQRLFDSIVVYETAARDPRPAPGVTAVDGTAALETGYPLVLDVAAADGLRLQLAYDRGRLGVETARRLLAHLAELLTALADGPTGAAGDLDALPAAERDLVVRAWNETDAGYPSGACLHELFERCARQTPDAPAIVADDGTVTTYGELDARANRLARYLRGLGAGPEQVVGVLLEHSVEMFVGLLGILKAGAAYLPLDPSHPPERLTYFLDDSGAGIVVTTASLRSTIPAGVDRPVVNLDTDAHRIAACPAVAPESGADARNLVYVMYTSGSTGRPKGVLVDHRGLVNYLWWARTGYGIDGADGAPMVGSIAFDLSVPNFFLPLISGRTVTLLPPDDDLGHLADLLQRPGDFSLLKITPGHLDVLRRMVPDDSVHSVRTFVVGADEVRTETAVAWRAAAPKARIIDEYGPTETVVGCSTYQVPADVDPAVPLPIGRPIANIRMYVLDEHLRPLPVGVTGELYIGGDGVARGYHERPTITAERFLPDPFSPATGARFYRTGDLARWRADGNLDFLGRADDQVKIRGYRVELGEVEVRVLAHQDVAEAVVIPYADANGDRRLAAYVVPAREGRPPAPEAVRDWTAAALPSYMVPSGVVVVPRLPLTPAGKVDRRALPAPTRTAPARRTGYTAPRDDTERTLTAVWEQTLDTAPIGVHDNFFELGGDSIVSVRLVALAQAADLPLTPRDPFQHPTVAELAALATSRRSGAPRRSAAEPAPPSQPPFPLAGLDERSAERLTGQLDERDTGEAYRLSPLQAGMLLHRLAASGVDEYLRQFVWDIEGDLDVDAFAAAWQRVIGRHDALRTRFVWDDLPHPVQVVGHPRPLVLERWDCRSVPSAQRADWLDRLAADERDRGLDVTAAPPLRLVLVRIGDRSHRLLWNVHHLLIDGWSRSIVSHEVLDTYAALRGSGPLPSGPPAPYGAYATWLAARPFSEAISYWRAALAGFGTPTPLPAAGGPLDGRPGDVQVGDVQVEAATIPDDVLQALRETASRCRIALPTVFQAGWAVLLGTYAGTDDVVFGTTLAGRAVDVAGIDRMVGMLMNTLPTRITMDDDLTVERWLRRLHDEHLARQEHVNCSLVDIARCAEVPPGRRLFQSLFVFERSGNEDARDWADIRVAQADGAPGGTAYPLVLNVSLAERLEVGLKYEGASYTRPTIARLLDDYVGVLGAIAGAAPGDRAATLRPGSLAASAAAAPAPGAVPAPPPAADRPDERTAEAERVLAGIWQTVLGVDRVERDDDYFALGGDSILAFQVVTLGRRAGLDLTVRHLLDNSTVARLAAAIAGPAPAPTEVAEPPVGAAPRYLPLTPAQRRLLGLRVRHDHHNQSTQLDWREPVDAARLERALRAVVAHHDALRLRLDQASRRQWVTDDGPGPLRVVALERSSAERFQERVRAVADELHRGLDLSQGPTVRAALVRAPGHADRVVVVIHHWAVDAYSWRILLADLATAYRSDAADPATSLPPATTTFAYWSTRLGAYARGPEPAAERPYWAAAVRGAAAPPAVPTPGQNREASARTLTTVLPVTTTAAVLRRASRQVSVQTLLLAALGETLGGWTGGPVPVDVEGHGREPLFAEVDLSRTVGWFTAVHPVVLRSQPDGHADRAVAAVADLVDATPRHGIGHSLLTHVAGGGPDLDARSWVSLTYFGQLLDQGDGDGLFDVADDDSTARDPGGERPYQLDVRAWVRDGRLHIDWTYPPELYDEATVRRLADGCAAWLTSIAPGPPAHWLAPRSSTLDRVRRQFDVPGVSVAVLSGGRLRDAWGEGVNGPDGVAVRPDTAFQACSVSKHVTALGVLRLVADGVLDLDEDVHRYLDGWTLDGARRPVTLRGLLSHTAGVTPFGHPGYARGGAVPELADVLAGRPPATTPPIVVDGTAGSFRYSCGNFSVVQQVLVRATGEPFPALMRALVLGPLGMEDSSFDQDFPGTRSGRVALGHLADSGPLPGGWHLFPEMAASGLWTTAADLARVAAEVRTAAGGGPSRVLGDVAAREMLAPATPDGRYGLGTIVRTVEGRRWYGHPGDRHSYQCFTAMDLEEGSGLVVMANKGTVPFLVALLAELDFPIPPAL